MPNELELTPEEINHIWNNYVRNSKYPNLCEGSDPEYVKLLFDAQRAKLSKPDEELVEIVAEWVQRWFQGGCAWVDLSEGAREYYRKNARSLLSTITASLKARQVKALELIDKLFEFACHGDYSNGNDAFGSDEGRYMASRRLGELEAEIKALKGDTNEQ